jgi:hypothetical protein
VLQLLLGLQTAAQQLDTQQYQRQSLTRAESMCLRQSKTTLLMLLLQVETHYSEYDPVWMSLRVVDQVCSIIFAAEWCFWLWLSRDRIGYVVAQHSTLNISSAVNFAFALPFTPYTWCPRSCCAELLHCLQQH